MNIKNIVFLSTLVSASLVSASKSLDDVSSTEEVSSSRLTSQQRSLQENKKPSDGLKNSFGRSYNQIESEISIHLESEDKRLQKRISELANDKIKLTESKKKLEDMENDSIVLSTNMRDLYKEVDHLEGRSKLEKQEGRFLEKKEKLLGIGEQYGHLKDEICKQEDIVLDQILESGVRDRQITQDLERRHLTGRNLLSIKREHEEAAGKFKNFITKISSFFRRFF